MPPLEKEHLFEGRDLPVDIDFRSVFTEVAGKHFSVDNPQAIFPGWQGPQLPFLR